MNRIYKTIITLAALVAAVSCYKEPEFDFAEHGPDMTHNKFKFLLLTNPEMALL